MSSSVRTIPLTKGFLATVDVADYERLAAYRWHFHTGYAGRWSPQPQRRIIFMHRVILAAEPGQWVDHIDANPLNNSRSNLRLCTPSENQHHKGMQRNNKSGYKGVYWRASRPRGWEARIMVNGTRLSLGVYDTALAAGLAYNAAARVHYGAFALLNEVAIP